MGQNTVGAYFGVVSVHDFLTQLDRYAHYICGWSKLTSMMKNHNNHEGSPTDFDDEKYFITDGGI